MSEPPQKSPRAFRTIGEVSDALGVQQHVLRFWEVKFPAVQPLKRGGNRRYYRPEDVALLRAINRLLYVDGYTIRGVQKLIDEHGAPTVAARHGTDARTAGAARARDAGDPAAGGGAATDGAVRSVSDRSADEPGTSRPVEPAIGTAEGSGLDEATRRELTSIRALLAEALAA